MINLRHIDAFSFRVPLAQPIKVSFGEFQDRPMVLIRVTDIDGATGWGEIWCNWPAVGAEHRARLASDLGQSILNRAFVGPEEVFRHLTRLTEILTIQTGELGPVAQVIAGIDIAVWDLHACRRGLPLARCLSERPDPRVPVYVTGINPDQPEEFAAARAAEGHCAFKLKIGFGREHDLRNIAAVREAIGPDAAFMIDANQSLELESALDIARAAAPYDLRWLEEPIRVDRPRDHWRSLADACPIPIAGGENLRDRDFADWMDQGLLSVVQPDITKWGGVTGCFAVAQAAVASGRPYCPHVFGGGLASLASLHVLASAGGGGLLEFDEHPNAGRELILSDLLPVSEGTIPVPQALGLGVKPDIGALSSFCTWASEPIGRQTARAVR